MKKYESNVINMHSVVDYNTKCFTSALIVYSLQENSLGSKWSFIFKDTTFLPQQQHFLIE